MAEYAPPTGPPPPKVPEGWKAVWNSQYSEYFYVNVYTKQSQWDKPTEPAHPPGEAPPHGAPPGYAPAGADPRSSMEKKNLGSNNPYGAAPNVSEDERLARQLQEEEEARARGHTAGAGSAGDFYSQGAPPNQYASQGYNASPYGGQDQGAYGAPAHQEKGKSKGGLLGKLLGKATGSSGSHSQGIPQQHGHYYGGQPGYGQHGYYPQQPAMMGGGGMMGGGRRPGGGGMGMGGAAMLGAGGGLLGGAMLGSAMADAGDGGDGGGDYGGDGGGDYGGDGGGDFGGGDMGGGDMGGGDF